MDAKFLQLPAQGMSDLQASYDHALAGLVKAGSELNRVGTEMDRAEIAFRHAINEYFNQLQFQIDHKDKAIRVLTEQKIGAFESIYSLQDQLAKLRNEKTFVNIENENVLPRGILQENFPGNVPVQFQDRTSGPLPNGTNHSALIHNTPLYCGPTSFSNGDYGRDTSEDMPYRESHRDMERPSRDDEVFDTWGKSTKRTVPQETAARLRLQDTRDLQEAVRGRGDYTSRNIGADMQNVIRQAQERLRRNPASAPENGIVNIIEGQNARGRLAESEEARQYVSEAWQSSSTDSSSDITRTFNENVFPSRSQLIEIEESHRGSATQDSSRTEFQPPVFQQRDRQNPFDQQQRTGELKASPWAKYKQGSTTEATESFRRQQAAHSWSATRDDKRSSGSTSKDPGKAVQPVGREPKSKAESQSTPSKGQSVSALNPRSPSFVPSNDKHKGAMTGRTTPPHKRSFKPESLNAELKTTSTIVSPAAINADPRNDTTIPPHKRIQVTAKAHRASPSIETDIDLIALEDELDPVTATHQYKFKATVRKGQTLAPLDLNTPKPLPTICKDSNGVARRTPTSSSLNELRELQTEAISSSPSYNAPVGPGFSVERPSQVWHENMYKQPHHFSGPPVQSSSPSASPRAVGNAVSAVQGLTSTDKPKEVPVQRKSTLVLASSPVKSVSNDQAHRVAQSEAEGRLIKNSPYSSFAAPFENKPPTMGEHKFDMRTENDVSPPTVIVSKGPTATPAQDFNLPKDNKAMSAAFMAAAQSKFSTFATKYGRDPESETRKEIAAKGRALKEKLASEGYTSNAVTRLRVAEDQYKYPDKREYDRPTILGTRVLGETLDPRSKDLVLKPNSRGEWFEINLDWRPVLKNGRICYILW